MLIILMPLFTDYDPVSSDRLKLDSQRIADGWYCYSFLELCQRLVVNLNMIFDNIRFYPDMESEFFLMVPRRKLRMLFFRMLQLSRGNLEKSGVLTDAMLLVVEVG